MEKQFHALLLCILYKQRTEAVYDKRREPCDDALHDGNEHRPLAAKLALDRGHCSNAGGIPPYMQLKVTGLKSYFQSLSE